MADEWHVPAELFRRFLDNRVTPLERRQVVRHLLSDCSRCAALVSRIAAEGGYWFPKAADPEPPGAGLEPQSVARFADRNSRRAAVERLLGWGHWSALMPLLPEERLEVVMAQREYRHWGLYRALLEAAHWFSFRDPREAVNVSRLALAFVELLDTAGVGGPEEAADLRAEGLGILGNALRLASDLAAARSTLNEAWRFLEEGTGDPLKRAKLLSFDASWTRVMGHFETAETILEESLQIYRAAGDSHMQGRTHSQMSCTIGYADPEKGIAHAKAALELINPAREPRAELCAQHDLVYFLVDAGRPQEALAAFDRSLALYQQFPDCWAQLRLRWVQARIARALGHLQEAIAIFRRVWEDCHKQFLRYDLVMISIELAEALAASGELVGATRLVADVLPILAEWGLERHILAAWLVLQQSLHEHRAASELQSLFGRLALYYRRHWNAPADFGRE